MHLTDTQEILGSSPNIPTKWIKVFYQSSTTSALVSDEPQNWC